MSPARPCHGQLGHLGGSCAIPQPVPLASRLPWGWGCVPVRCRRDVAAYFIFVWHPALLQCSALAHFPGGFGIKYGHQIIQSGTRGFSIAKEGPQRCHFAKASSPEEAGHSNCPFLSKEQVSPPACGHTNKWSAALLGCFAGVPLQMSLEELGLAPAASPCRAAGAQGEKSFS